MMLRDRVLFGADQLVAQWVKTRIPYINLSPDLRALGVVHDGDLVAGVVFERYNGVHIEASIAADMHKPWASRRTLRHLFGYPFLQQKCEAITVLVPASNLPSLNLATKLGFEMEALIKYAAPDGSPLIVLKQFRDRCRWI